MMIIHEISVDFWWKAGLDFLTELRSENNTNKKTLKQAWRFFSLCYLFVTSAGFKPATF